MVNDVYKHRVSYNKAGKQKHFVVEEVYGNWTITYAQLQIFKPTMVHVNPNSVVEIDIIRHNSKDNWSSANKRIFGKSKKIDNGESRIC